MVRPQGHREALRGRPAPARPSWPSGSPATPPSATPSPTAWRWRDAAGVDVPDRPPAARPAGRAGAPLQPRRRPRRTVQRRRLRLANAHACGSGSSCCGSTRGHRAPAAARRGRPRRGRAAALPDPAELRAIAATSPRSPSWRWHNSVVLDRFAGTAVLTRRRRALGCWATWPAPAASRSTPGSRTPLPRCRSGVAGSHRRRRAGPYLVRARSRGLGLLACACSSQRRAPCRPATRPRPR